MPHVGRRALVGLAVVVGSLWLAGCSNGASPADSPTPTSSTPSETASPTGAATYPLATGRIDVGEIPVPLVAAGGSISVSNADDGGLLVNALANGRRGEPVWALTLTVTNQGRASSGTLVAQGQTWNVTPGTGDVRIDRGTTAISMTTVRAITLTGALTPKTNTPLVVMAAGKAQAPQ